LLGSLPQTYNTLHIRVKLPIAFRAQASPKMSFEYSTLSTLERKIRLLHIPFKGGAGSSEYESNYELSDVSLDSEIDYTALSYCWGDPTARESILLNGKKFTISKNLYIAIEHIQDADEAVVIWADAICINQDSNEEKTEQVQLMHSIYSKARRVILWLGEATPKTDAAFDRINKIGPLLLQLGIWELRTEDINTWDDIPQDGSRKNKIKSDLLVFMHQLLTAAQKGIDYFIYLRTSNLGTREWFWRVWTLQECANAQQAIFMCGHKHVEYDCFWAFLFYFEIFRGWAISRYRTGDSSLDTRSYSIISLPYRSPSKSLGIRRKLLTDPNSVALSLKSLLCRTAVTDSRPFRIEATDPRDRVYALLGIGNDQASREIIPDYRLSCGQVYSLTAGALLRHGHLEILSLCRKRSLNENLPSWVPDWSAPNTEPWFGDLEASHFQASGSTAVDSIELEPKSVASCGTITLRGALVDTIHRAGTVWSLAVDEDFNYNLAHGVLEDVSTYCSQSPLYTEEQKTDAEWRVPIGDLEGRAMGRATTRARDGWLRMRRVTSFDNDDARNEYIEELNADHPDHGVPPSSRALHCYGRYMGRMERMHDSRAFISRIGYVGMCPMEAEPGDAVCILLGAQVPFVLRKRDDRGWQLVGEAHVYGIMDGEFMEMNPVLQNFRIV
jgi:Heterokaryon incompatibility protein (HET)